MASCYITRTARYLPGPPVPNEDISVFLGDLKGEERLKQRVLAMNGIASRHYAQDTHRQPTHDVYGLAATAALPLARGCEPGTATFLGAGTTYAPLAGPGIASILHGRLREHGALDHPVEISSHAGICSSASAALVGAARAVASGAHEAAICVGAEQASEVLKASAIDVPDDRDEHANVRDSQWFMAVFLRFMLSDGAGGFLLERTPSEAGTSLRIDWTHSASFAHEAPLCMQLDNRTGLLTQHLPTLSRHLLPSARQFVAAALEANGDTVADHKVVLPHISSFFFRDQLETIIREQAPEGDVPYWTNLATAGNTGSASIFVMLDEYLERHPPADGDRILLFVPESGQFNFVMVSLTAVVP